MLTKDILLWKSISNKGTIKKEGLSQMAIYCQKGGVPPVHNILLKKINNILL